MQRPTQKPTILGAAVNLARVTPYHQLSRRDIATAAECSSALVSFHFGTMQDLYDAVVDYAIQHSILRIVGDAVVQRHAAALALRADIKQAAISELTG